ncbi:hypothetical protein BDD21_2017 [Thiocapsa rosea]|uniref:Uncharacterized protein n=1 Tax=Thiocapsa rosea TaxID=69360 RepID=A0A495V7Y0_9GAMM|nr:hypothetical protein BDD21_2017 [Thiocapsa rosea]
MERVFNVESERRIYSLVYYSLLSRFCSFFFSFSFSFSFFSVTPCLRERYKAFGLAPR